MPEPRHRSRTYKRIDKTLPGGENITQHKKRTPNVAKCAKCGVELKGIPRLRDYKMKNLGKSKKSVERPYGGNLCSKCARSLIKEKARIS